MNDSLELRGLSRVGVVLALAVGTAGAGETIPVDLTFVPPGGEINRLNLTLTVTALGSTKMDTETTTVTGNALADLTIDFNHATHEAVVSELEFTGGAFSFSDVAFELDYGFLIGKLHARAMNVGGTLDTPNPPGSVAGQSFPAAEHQAIVNRGTMDAWATGLLGTVFQPMTIDLSQQPVPATGSGTGTLVVSPAFVAKDVADYGVRIDLPVNFNELVYEDASVSASIAGTGRFRAEGQFSRAVPLLGDMNGDGLVTAGDIDTLYDHVPSADIAYDVNGDGTVDQADVDELVLGVLGSEYGDSDLDGRVDFRDYLVLKGALGTAAAGWLHGDFDGDDDVDRWDFGLLAGRFGWTAQGAAAASGGAAVPEPAAVVLIALAGPVLLRRRHRA